MERALVLASVASMVDQFNMPNIRLMKEMGYEVDVATNFLKGSTCSDEKIAALRDSSGNECEVLSNRFLTQCVKHRGEYESV